MGSEQWKGKVHTIGRSPSTFQSRTVPKVGLESIEAELLHIGGLISRVELSFGKMLRPGMMSVQGKAVWA